MNQSSYSEVEDYKLIDEIKLKTLFEIDTTKSCQDVYLPASIEEIEWVETAIGYKLPLLIRELYLKIGNGGFGPACGIIGLLYGKKMYKRCFVEHYNTSVIEIKNHLLNSIQDSNSLSQSTELFERARQSYENWMNLNRNNFIWYCDWGCNLVTLVDITQIELPIYRADSLNVVNEPVSNLREWWYKWLDGKLV